MGPALETRGVEPDRGECLPEASTGGDPRADEPALLAGVTEGQLVLRGAIRRRVEGPCMPRGLVAEADSKRLHQVVSNLLSNALLYTSSGPILLRAARDGGGVVVEVEDHGPGLTPEEVGRVWESFYRGTGAAQLPNRGSGLGLTVVKQIVELHGGTVGVRRTDGGGATFWFTLPLA